MNAVQAGHQQRRGQLHSGLMHRAGAVSATKQCLAHFSPQPRLTLLSPVASLLPLQIIVRLCLRATPSLAGPCAGARQLSERSRCSVLSAARSRVSGGTEQQRARQESALPLIPRSPPLRVPQAMAARHQPAVRRALLLALCMLMLQRAAAAEAGQPSQTWQRSATLQQQSGGPPQPAGAAMRPAAEPSSTARPAVAPTPVGSASPGQPVPDDAAASSCSLLDVLKRSPNATTFVQAATATAIAP